MKTKITLLFILNILLSYSQPFTISWADSAGKGVYVGQNTEYFYYVIGVTETSSKITELSKADLKIKQQITFTRPTDKFGKMIEERYVILKNNIYFFQKNFYEYNNKLSVFANKINNNGSVAEKILVDEKKVKDSKDVDGIKFQVSDDGKKLLVLEYEKKDEDNSVKFTYKAFDENIKPLWSKDFDLPYRSKPATLPLDPIVKGDYLYFVGTGLLKPGEKADDNKPLSKLFCYNSKQNKLTDYSLLWDTISHYDYRMIFNKKNEPMCVGLYSNRQGKKNNKFLMNQVDYLNGAFCFTFSKGLDTVIKKDLRALELFPADNKHFNAPNTGYSVKTISQFGDGSISIVCESYSSNYVYDKNPTLRYTTYEFSDLIVFNVNCDKNNTWAKKIIKSQSSTDNYLGKGDKSHHSVLVVGGDNYLNLFVNSKKPKASFFSEIKPEKNMIELDSYKEDKSTTFLISIDKQGKITVTDFTESEKATLPFIYTNLYKIDLNSNEVYFGASTKKDNKFGKLVSK
ncbi:MAG: hypothetical protein ABIP51_08015 [Bacteroidia bacterium]